MAGKARVTRIPAWVCKERATPPDTAKCSCPVGGVPFCLWLRCSSVADRCGYASSSPPYPSQKSTATRPLPFMRWLLSTHRHQRRLGNQFSFSAPIQRLYSVDSHRPHRDLAAFPAMSLTPVAPFNGSRHLRLDTTLFPSCGVGLRAGASGELGS
jgi:hypothetical protein